MRAALSIALSTARPAAIPALGLVLLLSACTKKAAPLAEGECATAEDCADGLQCIDAACVQVDCTTSAECPFNSYCDVQAYTCVDGCREDADCLAGFACDDVANTCVETGCRDTQLDCAYGELCDEATGECVEDTRAHCQTCDALSTNPNQCDGGDCFYWGGEACNSAADCDPGYECEQVPGLGKICHADYCLVTCNPSVEDACPRGFECGDVTGMGDNYCYADCNYMTQNGYL